MDHSKFKYDVAFSLLARDEGLAQEINDLLSDRYKTFLYLERQKEIAGADGELKFKQIFAEEARLVVVMYRAGWGATPWTRMEEEAIRGRAYDEGYDFVKFIPLDEVQMVPKYLPRVQLWINALRFGAKSAAAVIEARLGELGAPTHAETAVERAARLERSLEFKARHDAYVRTHEAVNDAINSFTEITKQIENKLADIKSSGVQLQLQVKLDRHSVVVIGLDMSLRIRWVYNYANSLEGSYLDVELWNGHPPMAGLSFWEESKRVRSQRFNFELLTSGVGGWIRNGDAFDAATLADFALHYYMNNGE